MNAEKIYHLFLKEIKNQGRKTSDKKEEFRVIISFDDISKRDSFISKNKKLNILNKFDFIPSIITNLDTEQILKYEKEDLIKKIEEDQKLFLSIFEINEILDLNRCKNSQIPHTGRNVSIGIIDDGINSNFPSISIISRYDDKGNEFKKGIGNQITHGTIMASIISNQFKDLDNNSIGIAPDVKIFDFNVSNSKQEYYFSNVLEIFDLIVNQNIQIDMLLISLTTQHPSDGMDILSFACNTLVDKGILIVCPAGNYGPSANTIGSPSAAKKVISFGSLTKDLDIAYFSGRGPTIDNRLKPDFCLPGSEIKIPISRDTRIKVTGTSIAAAIGVGLIALIKEYNPKAPFNKIYELFKNSCRDLNLDKFSQGHGMPNITSILKDQDLIHERILPYNNLMKKSIKIAVEFVLVFIALFYLFYFFRIT